jgi:hypothetical protein
MGGDGQTIFSDLAGTGTTHFPADCFCGSRLGGDGQSIISDWQELMWECGGDRLF